MKNKLTELIKEAMQYADNRKDIGELYKPYEEYIAEYLIDNNTIVADVVSIVKTRKQTLVKLGTYNRATFTREYERYPISAIGKTVFLTKEALKGEGK